jgi:hypothetical protein
LEENARAAGLTLTVAEIARWRDFGDIFVITGRLAFTATTNCLMSSA